MKIGIIGSRDYADLEEVWNFVVALPPGTVLVSGGGPGVDTTAEHAADSMGFKKIIHNAKWDELGKRAGFDRNPLIARDSELVVAFHAPCRKCAPIQKCRYHGWSHGTSDTLEHARKLGRPTIVFTVGEGPARHRLALVLVG